MGDGFNLEAFRLTGSGKRPASKRKPAAKRARTVGAFIRGPLPLDWIARASNIPRRNALVVGLVLWHLAGLRGERSRLVLCASRCQPFGLGRKAVERGLRDLEAAELIRVERASGRCARVDLLG